MASQIQSPINEFNISVEKFLELNTVLTRDSLSCNLSVIDSEKDRLDFSPETIENCKFFINLHKLLECLDTKCDTTWICISILRHTLKDFQIREAIVNEYRFMSLLSNILLKTQSHERIEILLTILQDLSYGIQITWEEPYLNNLLEYLIKFIYDGSSNENDDNDNKAIINNLKLGSLSLSILINLCYRNSVVTYLLLRTIQLETFIKKITPIYGLLASKIQIIIDRYSNISNIKFLQYFIKQSFIEIHQYLKQCNAVYIKHIIDFLIDEENIIGMKTAIKEYNELLIDIEKIISLNKVEYDLSKWNGISDGDGNVSIMNNRSICMNLIFILLNHLLEITPSVQELSQQIFDLALQWLDSAVVAAKALEIMQTILQKDNETLKIDHLNNILPKLVQESENAEISSERLTAFFKLLSTLLNKSNTKNTIILSINESYFDKQFSPLISIKEELLNHKKFTTYDLLKYLNCFMIIYEFSNFTQEIWMQKIHQLFQKDQIQFIIAKSMLSGNEELCNLVFVISKIDGFPKDSVSKKITQLKSNDANSCEQQQLFVKQNEIIYTMRNLPSCSGQLKISHETELRLNELIMRIFKAKDNGELNNVATSELISLFHYKINSCKNTENTLTKRLENANSEITTLSHRINLLSKELDWYSNMNFKLKLDEERLLAENLNSVKERDHFKESLNVIAKDLKSEKSKVDVFKKRLDDKMAEIEILKKELNELKERDIENTNKIKKLEKFNADNTLKMKATLKTFEDQKNESKLKLEEKEKEILKLVKTITDLKESISKSENLLKHIQAQIVEKNEKIKQLEDDLRETDELRNTILTLMKPKRKNNNASTT